MGSWASRRLEKGRSKKGNKRVTGHLVGRRRGGEEKVAGWWGRRRKEKGKVVSVEMRGKGRLVARPRELGIGESDGAV